MNRCERDDWKAVERVSRLRQAMQHGTEQTGAEYEMVPSEN